MSIIKPQLLSIIALSILILLTAGSLIHRVNAIQATLGLAVDVTTTSSTYSYGASNTAPSLTVSASGAITATSKVTLQVVITIPALTINSIAFTSLPDGFAVVNLGLSTGAYGYSITLSADLVTGGTLVGSLSTPAIYGAAAIIASGSVFRILTYDAAASAYVQLPSSQYTINTDYSITITGINRNTQFYIASYSTTVATAPISASLAKSFLLAANSTQTLAITESGRATLKIQNLMAASGSLSVSISANAQTQTQAVVTTGRKLVSSVYTFSHSAGANAVQSAQLTYDTATSGAVGLTVTNCNWYKWDTSASLWVRQGSSSSSVSGSVVMYTTTSFSDWSVQTSYAFPMREFNLLFNGILGLILIMIFSFSYQL